MTSPVFEKINVPLDWTGERDIQEFVSRYGESDDYFGEVLAKVDDGYNRLEQSLDRMLEVSGCTESFAAHITDRVSTLRRHFSSKQCAEAHHSRFVHHLDYCRFTLIEYFRLMPRYLNGGDSNWLVPLIRLSDHLALAAEGLG